MSRGIVTYADMTLKKHINVLVLRELHDGTEPLVEEDFCVCLHVENDEHVTPAKRIDQVFLELGDYHDHVLVLCQRLRQNPASAEARIVLALPEADIRNVVKFSKFGVDEFMSAPLTRSRVLVRVISHLKDKLSQTKPIIFSSGNLKIDMSAVRVYCGDRPVHLAPTEYRLLCHFVQNVGQAFTRKQLAALIGRRSDGMSERNIDTWVGRMRRVLLGAGVRLNLRTVRSVGYILDEPPIT